MDDIGHFLKNVHRQHERFGRDEENRLLALAQGGDTRARERLIFSILPWAIKCAKKYCGPAPEDALSIACHAAVATVEKHDPTRSRLTTAAPWQVRQQVTQFLLKDKTIHIPAHRRDPQFTKRFRVLSLSDMKDDEIVVYPGWKGAEPPEDRQWLWDAVDRLGPRDRLVLRCRFLHGMTLHETGRSLDVSRERVRQIQGNATRRLRQILQREEEG